MESHQSRGRGASRADPDQAALQYTSEEDSLLNTRHIEAFGRTVHATASQLIGSNFASGTDRSPGPDPYRNALNTVHRFAQRPLAQRSVFALAKSSPRELIRNSLHPGELEHRALSYLPDELLRHVPESRSPFSLFEGFKASLPSADDDANALLGKKGGRGSKAIKDRAGVDEHGPPKLVKFRRDRNRAEHRLEMLGVRKTLCASEIREIDTKIANLQTMRKVVLDRLAGLEDEERELELTVTDMSDKLDAMQLEYEEELAVKAAATPQPPPQPLSNATKSERGESSDVRSHSSPAAASETQQTKSSQSAEKPKKRKLVRKASTPVLHEHMASGSQIREIQAHNDTITALDFDSPFGIMVTAALDDTVRVWDLNAGRCMGLLEGHLSSVRCLQVEDNLVATGSMDASIRLWDLSSADYNPKAASYGTNLNSRSAASIDEPPGESSPATGKELFDDDDDTASSAPPLGHYNSDAMADCHVFTLSSHVAEVTALTLRGSTLVSGSADKTLRQWDMEKGRCVQTLDVLWAAAQASTINPAINGVPTNSLGGARAMSVGAAAENSGWWRPTSGRLQSAEADFVGALQVFDAALACGTADGMVRLWDLRSGMVHRSLVGHTGPVTCLQFDDVYLVTGSRDRSIRIWDLRTGNIHDAFGYDQPITSMQFDARRIVAAAGEPVVKVYDKADGHQWDCGPSFGPADDAEAANRHLSIIERVRIKDGYLVEGRRDGVVGVWSC